MDNMNPMNPMGPDPNLYGGDPQPAMTYQDPEQPGYGGQPQPGFGGPQPAYGGQPQPGFGGPQPDFGAPQYGPAAAPQKSGGGKKGRIIGIIAAIVVVLGLAAVIVLMILGRNIKGAEEVSVKFMEAFGDLDFSAAKKLVPNKMRKDTGFGILQDDVSDELIEYLEDFDFEIDDIQVAGSERIDPNDAAEDYNDRYDSNVKFENAAKVEVTGNLHIEIFDEEEDEEIDVDITCAKIKGKWYVVEMSDFDEDLFKEVEEAVEAEEEEEVAEDEDYDEEYDEPDDSEPNGDVGDIDSISEVLGKSTAPSKLADVPEGVSDDPRDFTFSFDGKVYQLPFALKEFSGWTVDEEYFYKADEELDPGETTSVNRYENDSFDEWFYLYIGTCNPTDETVAYEDSYVRTFDAEMAYCNTDNYPEVILSKGITYGSSLQDVYEAYGEPDSIFGTYDGSGVYLYYYYDIGDELMLTVDYEDGVNSFEYYNWSWNKESGD